MIGFDDVAASALYTPPLTTVRQPMEAMGAGAVGIVLEGIKSVLEKREVAAHHRKVAPELVVRESTRSAAERLMASVLRQERLCDGSVGPALFFLTADAQ